MAMAIQSDLVDRAMHLSDDDRAELARRLILSLEPTAFDSDAEQAWDAEIARRLKEYNKGGVTPIDWRDATDRAQQAIRKTHP
jgi:putative addiction module component (TIGR02574 family)